MSLAATTNTFGLQQPLLRFFLSQTVKKGFGGAKSLEGFTPSKNDAFAACFSKSGTNWLMQIQYQIAWRVKGEFEHIHDVVPWPDGEKAQPNAVSFNSRPASDTTGISVIKTHLPAHLFPNNAADVCKFVTIHRDPKEILASAYPFITGVLNIRKGISLDEFVELLLENPLLLKHNAEFVTGFWERRERPNYMCINYADMKRDPTNHIRKIAELMEVDLSAEELATVVEKSSVQYMKSIGHKFRPPHMHFGEATPMIRRGDSGKARTEINKDQCKRIDDLSRQFFHEYNPKFPYDEYYK